MVTKYEALDEENDLGLAIIELKEGPYAGTKFSFGRITFGEQTDEGFMPVGFDYDVHEAIGLDGPTTEFEAVIGEIVISLLEDFAAEMTERDDAILRKVIEDAGIEEPECKE